MKRKLQIVTTFLLTLIIATSCVFSGPTIKGNGNVVKEERKTGDFDEIKVSRGMNVYVVQGDVRKVVVEADENLLEAIETRVDGNVLKVTAIKSFRGATSNKVFITIPTISRIKSTSGSNVYAEHILKLDQLELSSSSGSNMKLKVSAGNLEVSVASGSNIKLQGKAHSFSGEASSGSNLKAEGMKADDCTVKVSSGANIWVTAEGSFEAHASSGGNIFYYGTPESLDIEKSSGGNIIKK